MDILADIFKQAGLKSRHVHHRAFDQAMGLAFPCAKSIGFHVVTQGRAYIHSEGVAEPIVLAKGELALMARGVNHIVSTEPEVPDTVSDLLDKAGGEIAPGSGTPLLSLVSGAYQLWNTPVHPFFGELPEWLIVRADDIGNFDQLHMAINLLTEEVKRPHLGSDTVTQALLDIIFMHIVRKIVAQRDATPATWSHAVGNAQIRAALEQMHGDCAREWTLDELARAVGLSRAGFAQKFKAALGATPLQYLTTVRIQKAMDLLANTPDKILSVANAVGYSDAFSFSKVFKKVAGMPPGEFRLRDREERELAWRFQ
ncbi:MAG: AraC family transcriptional regulator [Pseudomonadota bacterium]